MEWAIVPFLQTRPQFIGMSWIIVDRSIFGDPVSGEGLKNLLRGKKKSATVTCHSYVSCLYKSY